MYEETIKIDIDRLREELKNDCLGAFFGGGFGGSLIEAGEVARASPGELVEYALRNKINIEKYIIM